MGIGQWDLMKQAGDFGDRKQIKMTTSTHILHHNTPPLRTVLVNTRMAASSHGFHQNIPRWTSPPPTVAQMLAMAYHLSALLCVRWEVYARRLPSGTYNSLLLLFA